MEGIVKRRQRHNRIAILGFEFLWGIAIPFVQPTTTLPGYLKALGASALVIGLVPAVFSGGIAIVQPLSLYLIRPGPRRLGRMLGTYRVGACFYLIMAASAGLLPQGETHLRVATFFLCYTAYVLIAGMGDPHYIAMVVASSTPRERGWFFGLRIVWFGLGGLLGGLLAAPVLRALPVPQNFGLSIFVGATIILTATAWFARFRDAPTPDDTPHPSLLACLTDVGHLARQRRPFLLFLLATSLFVMAQGPFAFLALFIKERLHAGDALLAHLGFLFAASTMIFALVVGRLGDRFGHSVPFVGGLLLYAFGLGAVLLGSSAPTVLLAYFLASTCSPVWQIAAFNLGLECAGHVEAARIYAAINLTSAPWRVLGPLLAGAAVDRWGYPVVFATAALLSLVGALIALPRALRGPNSHEAPEGRWR